MPHTCPSYPCPLPPALAFSCPLLQNIVWQEMDSKALKRAYGMQPHQKGVLVRGAGRPASVWGGCGCGCRLLLAA